MPGQYANARTGALRAIAILLLFAISFVVATVVSAEDPPKGNAPVTKEERRARHILVATEAEADDLIGRIQKGESFVDLCRQHSLDVVTKRTGGGLDWVRPGSTVAGFDRLFTMEKEGDVAKAHTTYGWHVIQFQEKRLIQSGQAPAQPGKGATPKPDNAKGQPAAADPAKPADKPTPDKPKPPRVARNTDLEVTVSFDKKGYHPDEGVTFQIAVKNASPKILNVFNPELWPLGLYGRYRNRDDSVIRLKPKGGAEKPPADGYYLDLDAGKSISRQYRLEDYVDSVDEWPQIVLTWRGDQFVQNLGQTYPEVKAHADFANWVERWRSYAAPPSAFSVLPTIEEGEHWHACFYFGSAKIWTEITDPGVPGLVDHWSGLVRDGFYSRARVVRQVAGKNVFVGENVAPSPFALPPSWQPTANQPWTLALAVDRTDGGYVATGQFYFFLENPADETQLAIPVGKIVTSKPLLNRIAENKVDQRAVRSSNVDYVDLFHDSILSAEAREFIARGGDVQPQGARLPPSTTETLPIVEMHVGDVPVKIQLYEDWTPNTVAHFIQLVDEGFYEGKTFFIREKNGVNPGWIQGGSPDGTITGDLKYCIKDEVLPGLAHARGSVAMAGRRDGPLDGASTQFYICFGPQRELDGKFTIFGHVTEGLTELENMPVPATMHDVKVSSRREHKYEAMRSPIVVPEAK